MAELDEVVLRPDVTDLKRRLDDPFLGSSAKYAQIGLVLGDGPDRQHRVAQDLELLEDGVVEARVQVVGAPDHQHRHPAFGLDLVQDGPAFFCISSSHWRAAQASSQAKSDSSSVMSRASRKASNICRRRKGNSVMVSADPGT